ncbi:hypothetical protein FRB94_010751 [Tulasnella sp. JGI-2019a]|nr:hypothetical protein FRB94_010751 [Tulasnella sp. JGI-2019a]
MTRRKAKLESVQDDYESPSASQVIAIIGDSTVTGRARWTRCPHRGGGASAIQPRVVGVARAERGVNDATTRAGSSKFRAQLHMLR